MPHGKYGCNEGCPAQAAPEVIGGEWKGVILNHLFSGGWLLQLTASLMPEIFRRMFTKQLRSA